MPDSAGGCLCGRIRYRVDATPTRVTTCHCRFCQRATGSGHPVYVNFCDNCGTKIFLAFDRWPDIIGIYGGTFDDPNWFDLTPDNSKQILLSVAQNGMVMPGGIDTFKEHATTVDGTPIEPTVFQEPKVIGE